MKKAAVVRSETRTYWMVCEARADGKWFSRGDLLEDEEEGQRRLRWLRQWHPDAFLVEMVMTTVADHFHAPSLPVRSSKSITDSRSTTNNMSLDDVHQGTSTPRLRLV